MVCSSSTLYCYLPVARSTYTREHFVGRRIANTSVLLQSSINRISFVAICALKLWWRLVCDLSIVVVCLPQACFALRDLCYCCCMSDRLTEQKPRGQTCVFVAATTCALRVGRTWARRHDCVFPVTFPRMHPLTWVVFTAVICGFSHAAHHGITAAVLPALEQLPEQSDQRLRPAPPKWIVRRCDIGVRWTQCQSAQDGVVRLQPVLPIPLLRESLPASHRHHAGH